MRFFHFLHVPSMHFSASLCGQQTNKRWKISGILDWEFTFSGSTLCDVANMLVLKILIN